MNNKSTHCKSCNSSISRTTKVCTYCGDDIRKQRNADIWYKSAMFFLAFVLVFTFAMQLGALDHLFGAIGEVLAWEKG